MIGRRFLFVSFFVVLWCSLGAAPLTRETVTFHNDAFNMEQSFYPNESLMKRSSRDMKVLARQAHDKTYSHSAVLIAQLRKMYVRYFKLGHKMALRYEKKWGQRHYQSMDQEWKDKTFAKHREKVKKLFLLFNSAEKAFNTWNQARNQAVKLSDRKRMAAAFSQANKALEKEINYIANLEKATFKDLADDIERLSAGR